MQPREIEDCVQKDPDDVDKMPVQPAEHNRRVVFSGHCADHSTEQQPRKDTDSNNHVDCVESGHDEVEDEKHLYAARIRTWITEPDPWRPVFLIVLVVLGEFEA